MICITLCRLAFLQIRYLRAITEKKKKKKKNPDIFIYNQQFLQLLEILQQNKVIHVTTPLNISIFFLVFSFNTKTLEPFDIQEKKKQQKFDMKKQSKVKKQKKNM